MATAFLKGGLTLDEIIAGWSRQGATLGIREYYSVNTWDRDLPAQARGGNLDYLRRTIPEFHARGARFMSAESSDNWGPNGLGYYLAARMLWDVDEARTDRTNWSRISSTRAFGPAKEPMAEFYRQLDGSEAAPGRATTNSAACSVRSGRGPARWPTRRPIRRRLDDLMLYARYVDLYHRYAKAEGAARQAAFEQLIRHAYRMRKTMLVHTKALYRDLAAPRQDRDDSGRRGVERAGGQQPVEVERAVHGRANWRRSSPRGSPAIRWPSWISSRSRSATTWCRPRSSVCPQHRLGQTGPRPAASRPSSLSWNQAPGDHRAADHRRTDRPLSRPRQRAGRTVEARRSQPDAASRRR